jgi:hypothetical protein
MEKSGCGSEQNIMTDPRDPKHTQILRLRFHNTVYYIVEFRTGMHCKKGCALADVTGTWQLAGYMNITFFIRTGEACGIPLKVGGRELHLNIIVLFSIRIKDPTVWLLPVLRIFRIQIHRIHMILGLPNSHPDPSIIKQKW